MIANCNENNSFTNSQLLIDIIFIDSNLSVTFSPKLSLATKK